MSSVAAPEPRPVRFGILGCATIARKMARAMLLAPGVAVAAVGSRSEEKARLFATDNGLPAAGLRLHGTYEALLDDPDVDAVYIPLPTSLHVRWATAAAARGKHLLLEKPTALCAADLDAILATCDAAGVQFMDSTMWMHHPRTAKMRDLINGKDAMGDIKVINSVFSFRGNEDFLQNDIRVKPDLDALGALGDVGWYCIRAILWAVDYELPKTVIALRYPVKNQAGVLLDCGATLYWADGKTATFNCSFLTNLTMDITLIGTNGTLHVTDFVIPYQEKSAEFSLASKSEELDNGWDPLPNKHVVMTDLPQEALMVQEFARLLQNIRDSGSKPEGKWPAITRKTQVVLDAVKASIDKGSEPVEVVN
ncbi:hypothetical protein EJB05_37759 [Eragrostis curvula]|uniref:Uncharacterized protein n=1 Tax=Eragrostis curvula TaxID=38414 RepID=A0A5J9TU08_9POAL|nr:hypothetical protein EJB05_37759 [Eragrostis curvula]